MSGYESSRRTPADLTPPPRGLAPEPTVGPRGGSSGSDAARGRTGTTPYPCDKGTGMPMGYHYFQVSPTGRACCVFCGKVSHHPPRPEDD